MQWLGEKGVPFAMVFTKADKQSKTRLQTNLQQYNAVMMQQWEELPGQFLTSSVTREGSDAILDYIEELNTRFVTPDPAAANKSSGNLS